MKAIINQPFGLGDIIFEQTLVRSFNFEQVIWPVQPQFVEGLNRAYPDIYFQPTNGQIDFERKDLYINRKNELVLPLRFADSLCRVPYMDCMKSKYLLYDQSWTNWQQNAMWHRNLVKEQALWDMFRLPEKYILSNSFAGSGSQIVIPTVISSSIPVIRMYTLPGFSLFDWAKIIQGATEIHTVSSSIIYLLEMLQLRAKEIYIYPRGTAENHKNYDYILRSHNYILR